MPGQWESVMQSWPLPGRGINAIHMVLLRTGRVLVIATVRISPWGDVYTLARVWDPQDPLADAIDVSSWTTDLFCAGHCSLSDGRILVAGGGLYPPLPNPLPHGQAPVTQSAPRDVNIFDPAAPPGWRVPPLVMRFRRHYPTCTTLWDERILISAGWETRQPITHAEQLELFDPQNNTFQTLAPVREQKLYPFMFVLPEGAVLDAGPARWSQKLFPPDPPTHPDWRWEEDPVTQTRPRRAWTTARPSCTMRSTG
jgi:hypothetical protein